MAQYEYTTKELAFVEDEVRAEELTAKTMNWFASLCDDDELAKILDTLAESHQERVGELVRYFNYAQTKH